VGRGQWPDGVLVQTCGMGKDPFFALAGGLDAARELAATAGPQRAGLFACPARRHLFIDSSLRCCDLEPRRWGCSAPGSSSTG
jgi:hypothetical protein